MSLKKKSAANIRHLLDKKISSVIRQFNIDKKPLGSKRDITYTEFLSDKMLMISVIRNGVPYSLFNLIQHYAPFSEIDWANFLGISAKSLQRYKQSSKIFKSTQSEKIIEMAEVTHVGLEVFGNIDKFKLWLDTSNYALGGLKPMELLKDSYGKEMVIGELTRIGHGILV